MMRIIGLDPSVTNYGVSNGHWVDSIITRKLRGHARLANVITRLSTHLRVDPPWDLAVIEGVFSHSVTGRHDPELIYINYHTRQMLWTKGIPYVVIAPKTRAMWATGNGNASKLQVLASARKWGRHLHFDDDNQADAWWLAALGHHGMKQPLPCLRQLGPKHVRALTTITWPEQIAS